MKPITIQFNQGVQFPIKLGTLILKPTSEGKAAYTQNIDVQNDEYGNGSVVPGPALTTIGSNSELTGVPFASIFYGSSTLGYLYFLQGLLGTKTVIRRIKDIISGSTPTIDTTGSMTVDHTSHASQVLLDILLQPNPTDNVPYVYVAGKDATDVWIYRFTASDASPSLSLIKATADSTFIGADPFMVVGSDNKIYWISKRHVSSIDVATGNTYALDALANQLPVGTFGTAGVDWNKQLVVAYSTEANGEFTRRLSGGTAGIIIWDYVSPSFTSNIVAPCKYISAMVTDISGGLLVFGGMSEGKSSIYEFTGYGFNHLCSYIGDMPRSRHSIKFDGQGRVLFQTADGQLCRYDKASGIFEHLGSITTASSAGGLLAKGIGSPIGNEFFVASGSGSTYLLKKVQFGSFLGDDAAGTDTVATPIAVSGIQVLPQGSNITAITLHLAKSLQTGEKVELRIYANGSTSYTVYMTMSFADDGAVSSKREVLTLDNINSFSLACAFKQTDGLTTAPPVLSCSVEVSSDKG